MTPPHFPTHSGLLIVGLGPGDPGLMPRAVWSALQGPGPLILRTTIHPTVSFLIDQGVGFESCDDLYESSPDFETTYERIAARVLERVNESGAAVFAVPGHPMMGEQSVNLLRSRASQSGIPLRIIPAPGFLDVVLPAVGLDIGAGVVALDAVSPALPLPGLPAVYYQAYDRQIVSDLKLTLLESLTPDMVVWHVHAAGTPDETVTPTRLYLLDHLEYDHLTTLVIPAPDAALETSSTRESAALRLRDSRPLIVIEKPQATGPDMLESWTEEEELEPAEGFDRLLELMARLRSPGGCPWDQEQTFASLRKHLLEEAYEAVECVDHGDHKSLVGELGDLLLIIVFYARIAAEDGLFDIDSVITAICEKLLRRHPHVFGNLAGGELGGGDLAPNEVAVRNSADVVRNWDAIKKAERYSGGGSGAVEFGGFLSGIAETLPALTRADKVFRKAAGAGFDWPDHQGALAKASEELDEVREAIERGDPTRIEAEVGDLFLAAINLARKLNLDPETTARTALQRFLLRFREMERLARENGSRFEELDPVQQDGLWEAAKKRPGCG